MFARPLAHRSVSSDPPFPYPVRRIAGWQIVATGIVAAVALWWSGWHGALSAVLGGFVNVSAGIVFAALARIGWSRGAVGTVAAMIRAEAGKITVIVLQLWAVLASYRDVVHGAFFAAFVVTVLITQAAILIRD